MSEPLRNAIEAVVSRWHKGGLLRFNSHDDGSDDLLLRDELWHAALGVCSEYVAAGRTKARAAVLPDSDAPTPREATLRRRIREIADQMAVSDVMAGPGFGEYADMLYGSLTENDAELAAAFAAVRPGYVEVERLDRPGNRANLDAASTAPAGEDADALQRAYWGTVSRPDFWERAAAKYADLRSRATSETPRETSLAGPLDVERLARADYGIEHGDGFDRESADVRESWLAHARLLADEYRAARGSE